MKTECILQEGSKKEKCDNSRSCPRTDHSIEQLIGLIDEIDLNQLGMRQKIEEEISRYQKFTTGVLGSEAKIPKVDVRKYAKDACPAKRGFERGEERGKAGVAGVFEDGVEGEEKYLANLFCLES